MYLEDPFCDSTIFINMYSNIKSSKKKACIVELISKQCDERAVPWTKENWWVGRGRRAQQLGHKKGVGDA